MTVTVTQQEIKVTESLPPAGSDYLTFTISTELDDARKRFIQRFGQAPQEYYTYVLNLYVGPAPDKAVVNG